MTTLLEREQVDTLRGVKNVAAVWLVMQMVDRRHPGRAVKVEEIAGLLEMDRRTVEKQVNSLCFSNRAVKKGQGYVLTEGRALLLQAQVEAQDSQALAQQALQSDENYTHKVCVSLKKKEEDVNLINLDSSSSDLKSAQGLQKSGDEPSTREILEAAEMLFENGVTLTGLPLEAINPLAALGWVAQAYSQRERLHNPAGLVYQRLRDPSSPKPQAKYLHDPMQFLPHEYLARLGLAMPLLPEEEHEDNAGPVVQVVQADPKARELWEKVKEWFLNTMARVAWQTWVSDTVGIRQDNNHITIAARNAYAAEWLRENMQHDHYKFSFVVAEVES